MGGHRRSPRNGIYIYNIYVYIYIFFVTFLGVPLRHNSLDVDGPITKKGGGG